MSKLTTSSDIGTFLSSADSANALASIGGFPLSGGTLDADALITFDNGARLQEGTTVAGANGGIALKCSVDYELKWEAGQLYIMEQDGFTIRVEQYGFTTVPTVYDDETKGYVIGSRRILDDGTAYVCTDATTDAAVWEEEVIITDGLYWYDGLYTTQIIDLSLGLLKAYNGSGVSYPSVDWNNRQLISTDGVVAVLDWSNFYSVNIPTGVYLGVDMIYDADSPQRYIDVENGVMGDYYGFNTPSIDWANRQLIANDGTTVLAQWSNAYYFEANQIYGIGGSIGIDYVNGSLLDGSTSCLNWFSRQLLSPSGTVMLDWSDTGGYGIINVNGNHFMNVYSLADASDVPSLYVNYRQANDSNFGLSIDWESRQLMSSGGFVALDWSSGYADAYGFITSGSAAQLPYGAITSGFGGFEADSVDGYVLAGYGNFNEIFNTSGTAGPTLTFGAKFNPLAVSSLVGDEGTVSYVNDADTPVIGVAVVGGGSSKCLVCFNGTDWIVTSLL